MQMHVTLSAVPRRKLSSSSASATALASASPLALLLLQLLLLRPAAVRHSCRRDTGEVSVTGCETELAHHIARRANRPYQLLRGGWGAPVGSGPCPAGVNGLLLTCSARLAQCTASSSLSTSQSPSLPSSTKASPAPLGWSRCRGIRSTSGSHSTNLHGKGWGNGAGMWP